MEDRLADLLESPRFVARVSSWSEAQRLLTEASPATVLVDSELVDPTAASKVVQLDDQLTKAGATAYILADDANGQIGQWTEMFDSINDVLDHPDDAAEWHELAERLRDHLPGSPSSTAAVDDEPVIVDSTLPDLSSGSLDDTPLSRLLYAIDRRDASGVLQLKSEAIERQFAFDSGSLVDSRHGANALMSAYAWTSGTFRFRNTSVGGNSARSMYSLMLDGLFNHRSQRQLMNGLMSRMSSYPAVTDLWEKRRRDIDEKILVEFLNHCTGERTLEKVIGNMGSRVTEAFGCAAFGRDTDLVVFRSQQTTHPIRISYVDSNSGGAESDVDSDAAARRDEAELRQTLRSRLDTMNSQSPHEIFEVWEGCGREVVKQQYYSMVKKHHPDSYGGNVSEQVRTMAQRIFVNIRDAYSELLETEEEQTVPPPDERDQSSEASDQHPTDRQSAPGRRARRQQLDTLNARAPRNSAKPTDDEPDSGPIEMGDEPSTPHPDAPGLNQVTDPEWRKEQLQRLQKSTKKKKRRTTTSTGSSSSPPSGDAPPEKRAQKAFNSGYKHYKNERYEKALPLFEKAHELHSGHGLYMTFLANTLFQIDPDQAPRCTRLLRDAIDTENRQALPDAHLFLGNILKVTGRADRAYKHFQRALELNPSCRDAEREIRLHERRQKKNKKNKKDSGGFLNKFFNK